MSVSSLIQTSFASISSSSTLLAKGSSSEPSSVAANYSIFLSNSLIPASHGCPTLKQWIWLSSLPSMLVVTVQLRKEFLIVASGIELHAAFTICIARNEMVASCSNLSCIREEMVPRASSHYFFSSHF